VVWRTALNAPPTQINISTEVGKDLGRSVGCWRSGDTEGRRREKRCNGGAENNSQRTTNIDLHHGGGGFGLGEESRLQVS